MESVYNLLREACGISQAEAASNVHHTRLDTVKSWSSDRRPAPEWAVNQLQKLLREIRKAGETYADILKRGRRGNTDPYILRLAYDDDDARKLGFPSLAAQQQALAIAASLLPDDAEIVLMSRTESGKGDAPALTPMPSAPTDTDLKVLRCTRFVRNQYTPPANSNQRKFERLASIGWLKPFPSGDTTLYELTADGQSARSIKPGEIFNVPGEQGADTVLMKAIGVEADSTRPKVFGGGSFVLLKTLDGERSVRLPVEQALQHWTPA
jgi:hypothetical protein